MTRESGRKEWDTHHIVSRNRDKSFKVPRQCLLVLLVKLDSSEGRAFRCGENEAETGLNDV
jgi:hypothetical protein